mgnify:CR=1 FL=1
MLGDAKPCGVMVGSTLHRFRANARYCGWDLETESLNLRFARPFQVAYCIADNKTIETIRSDFIWWPDLEMSEDAAHITRFNPGTYKLAARPAAEILEEFDAVIYDPSVETVFQNGLNYDVYIHQNWRRLCGKPVDFSYIIRSIDLTTLTKALRKGWQPDISSPEAFLAWQYKAATYHEKGLKSNLEFCGKEEKIEHDYGELHEAANDVVLMMKVYWKRLYQLEF